VGSPERQDARSDDCSYMGAAATNETLGDFDDEEFVHLIGNRARSRRRGPINGTTPTLGGPILISVSCQKDVVIQPHEW
jgi:hypothetical protein